MPNLFHKLILSKSFLWLTLELLIVAGPSFSARFRHSEATTEELATEDEYSDETEPTEPETGNFTTNCRFTQNDCNFLKTQF